MAVSSLGQGMANQVTLTDNYSDSQSRVISYPALPSNPTWASVARISLPAGRTTRPGSFKEWENVALVFDIGCGTTTPVGDTSAIQMTPVQIMNTIRTIELRVNETTLFILEQGEYGAITQIWMQSLLKRMTPEIYVGESLLPLLYGVYNFGVNETYGGTNILMNPMKAAMMARDVRINRSDLFSGLFTKVDPRVFGNDLEIVITYVDTPVILSGSYQALLYYSHFDGDGTTVDLRSSWGLVNLRAEIQQNEYLHDPWAKVYQSPRTHTISTITTTTVPFAADGTYRIMLGQSFSGRTHINAFHLWYQTIWEVAGSGSGTTMAENPRVFAGLHQAIYSITPTGQQSILKFECDGESVFELDTQGALLDNNIQYQKATFGEPKNRPLPCYSAAAIDPEGPLGWDSLFFVSIITKS